MIFGNGLLAKAFTKNFDNDPQIIVFASGVSNSGETRAEQFERERALLFQNLCLGKSLLYFSTCSIDDPQQSQSPYVLHKLRMEQLIQANGSRHAIFRLPQVVGHCANPHTLTNYLFHQISSGEVFNVWLKAQRNLIDVDDVASIATCLVQGQQAFGTTTNIACPFSVSILELVNIFEKTLGKPANYTALPVGAGYAIDTRQINVAAIQAGVVFGDDYVSNLIQKYYA
jgi:nucleoside-diphosphate-sugar epimerase